jgi:hypothetical protein
MSPGADQIPAELIQAGGGGTLHSEIHKLIKFIWNKELSHQWKESIVIPIHKKIPLQMKLLGITSVDFDVIGQQLIRLSVSIRY